MSGIANSTGAKNTTRLVTLQEELGGRIRGMLEQRQQDVPWHEIEGLTQYEDRESARNAFGELQQQYEDVIADLELLDGVTDLTQRGRRFADQVIPARAAPTPAMMTDRPPFVEAMAQAVYQAVRSDGDRAVVGQGPDQGVYVQAEDVNLLSMHGPHRLGLSPHNYAEWDIGSTGDQGLGLPQGFIPGSAPPFMSGVMAIDLFQPRAMTVPNTSGIRWNARTANANVRSSFKIASRASVGAQDAASTNRRLSDNLTQGMLHVDAEWQAIDAATDTLPIVMQDLDYEYRDAMSYQALQAAGANDDNRGFAYYSSTTGAGDVTNLAAREVLDQFHDELTAADFISHFMSLRSTLAVRGHPPMVALVAPEQFEPLTATQVTDGTPFDSAFGALFATMQQTLRGIRLIEVVRGFAAVDGADDIVSWLYPFSGPADAVHFMRGFRIQRDEYTQADNAQTRWRLYCEDALRVGQPHALGVIRGAAS